MTMHTVSRHAISTEEKYARSLTERIRTTAEGLYSLLLEARESKAYTHLGYKTWSAYIATEFEFGIAYANRLVKQAEVIRELSSAIAPDGAIDYPVHISEAAARDIAPLVGEVVEDVRERVAAGEPPVVAVQAAVSSARAPSHQAPITRTPFRDDVAEEEPDYGHVHECRICGAIFKG